MKCIAYRESYDGSSVIYMPCGERIVDSRKGSRLCKNHARVLRELLLGIAMQAKEGKPCGRTTRK